MATELPNPSLKDTPTIYYRCTLGASDATCDLAGLLASSLIWEKGDQITLSGPLGSGKSVFARAFIRTFLEDQELTVPSPTFTLMQTYTQTPPLSSGGRPTTLLHTDFYRLHDMSDLISLGWEDESEESLTLIEWPTHVPEALKPNRLDLTFSEVAGKPEERLLTISAHGKKSDCLDFIRAAYNLVNAWTPTHHRLCFKPLDGDASARRYVRISREHDEALLMISPPMPPTSYSLQTHLAHDVRPFVAMSHGLRSMGLSAPEIYGVDENAGVLLVEDLGNELLTLKGQSHRERLHEAVRLLSFLHTHVHSERIPYGEKESYYVLPPYDRGALQTEISVFLEWYLHTQKCAITPENKEVFFGAWEPLLTEIIRGPRTWTLRDYHSPNVLWLEPRNGLARLGLLDFQDAVWGHPAYDLASLLQDARITIEPKDEKDGYALYVEMRIEQDPHFNEQAFSRAYAILAVQRATKVLGVFARLIHRDGKTRYANHIPRVQRYLARTLASNSLFDDLRSWYQTHLPALFMDS